MGDALLTWGCIWPLAPLFCCPLTVKSIPYAGPLKFVPMTFGKNYLHSCPELVRQKPCEMLDCCAHDMWGAGYLMHRVLTNTSPWWFPSCGSAWKDRRQLCQLHEDWVSPCCLLSLVKPDPFPSVVMPSVLALPLWLQGWTSCMVCCFLDMQSWRACVTLSNFPMVYIKLWLLDNQE